MKVVYNKGRGNGEIECDTVDEGDTGLFLLDESGFQKGYIPYDSLFRVVPDDHPTE